MRLLEETCHSAPLLWVLSLLCCYSVYRCGVHILYLNGFCVDRGRSRDLRCRCYMYGKLSSFPSYIASCHLFLLRYLWVQATIKVLGVPIEVSVMSFCLGLYLDAYVPRKSKPCRYTSPLLLCWDSFVRYHPTDVDVSPLIKSAALFVLGGLAGFFVRALAVWLSGDTRACPVSIAQANTFYHKMNASQAAKRAWRYGLLISSGYMVGEVHHFNRT